MKNKGFSLPELLGVIAILAVLILMASTNIFGILGKSKEQLNNESLKALKDAAISYALENKNIPSNCAVESEVTDTFNPPCSIDPEYFKVKIEDLINQDYFQDPSGNVKRNGEVIVYKYKYVNDKGIVQYDIKAYVSESVLNK